MTRTAIGRVERYIEWLAANRPNGGGEVIANLRAVLALAKRASELEAKAQYADG